MAKIQLVQATDIVTELDKIMPYEVMISDADGVIIASSNIRNVGNVSEAARQCIATNQLVEVEKNNQGRSIGVTAPLHFEQDLVGTISLLGNPKHVISYVKLVKVTTELLLAQAHTMQMKLQKRQSINDFLQEWLFRTKPYSETFVGRGHLVGIQVNQEYQVIMISNISDMEQALSCMRAQLEIGDYWYACNTTAYAVITRNADTLAEKTAAIAQTIPNCRIGIGQPHTLLNGSLRDATKAIEIGQRLEPQAMIFDYAQLEFPYKLSTIGDENMFEVVQRLCNDVQGPELLETVKCYIKNHCEMLSTAKELYIHRNTLKYRMEKIHNITGKDPRSCWDLFYLYTAIIHYLMITNS